jgi:hypothetical protein
LIAHRFHPRPVRLDRSLYTTLRGVSEAALRRTESPSFSPRLKSRAVKLAAAAALLTSLADPGSPELAIHAEEAEFARRFYEDEIRTREGRRGAIE